MNKIRPYLVVIALMILSGCSSSDDGPSGPQVSNNLFGEWTLDFIIVNGDLQDGLVCEEKIDYKFNSDNTYTKTEFTTNSQDNCVESINFSGTWDILSESSLELSPNSPSVSGETLDFELIDNESKLQITRNTTRTEVYERPQ